MDRKLAQKDKEMEKIKSEVDRKLAEKDEEMEKVKRWTGSWRRRTRRWRR